MNGNLEFWRGAPENPCAPRWERVGVWGPDWDLSFWGRFPREEKKSYMVQALLSPQPSPDICRIPPSTPIGFHPFRRKGCEKRRNYERLALRRGCFQPADATIPRSGQSSGTLSGRWEKCPIPNCPANNVSLQSAMRRQGPVLDPLPPLTAGARPSTFVTALNSGGLELEKCVDPPFSHLESHPLTTLRFIYVLLFKYKPMVPDRLTMKPLRQAGAAVGG